MNACKLRAIIGLIRSQGELPTDGFGQILCVDDLMAWFGLSECLTREEQLHIRRELAAMVDAELAMERLRQLEEAQSTML
jgi:hypothetical protein